MLNSRTFSPYNAAAISETFALGMGPTSAGTNAPVNVQHIVVEPTYENLSAAFKEPPFLAHENAMQLLSKLKALEKVPGANSLPSNRATEFYDTINRADPNDPTFDEDNSNAGWGHRQFTGSWKIGTALESYDDVGSAAMAYKLLSAAVKTRRVAEFICLKRRIRASSYIADQYVGLLVDKLWELTKDLSSPAVANDSNDPPNSVGSGWLRGPEDVAKDLKDWLNDHEVDIGKKKNILKGDLIKLVHSSNTIPSAAEVSAVVKAHKAKQPKKST
ncbi:hypothetical protein BKA70DRAFT_1428867 [Coprinopsis sp. MPI-PUGE-AT-0042]|nr:hypothetical protein BKA70DRAFT_1428867 [Coprinopsis sp. MPI-PUGE-AT-0042]